MPIMRTTRTVEIDWPEFGGGSVPPRPTLAEFEARLEAVRAAMEHARLTHLVVYGDREHFANLAYLTGFDPRFEEALLVVRTEGAPLLIVGNECEGYLPISPLWAAGRLRHERFQSFSLLDQPRDQSRFLADIFSDEAIGSGAAVGCTGWKYFAESEHPAGVHVLDLPAYIVDTLRALAGWEHVVNATDLLMHPGYGLRSTCSPADIAYLEYSGVLASEGLRRMLFGLREGMTDHEMAQCAGYNGEPLSCHMTLAVGDRPGLAGPGGVTIRRGDTLAFNVAYWGSNCCRAGWVAASARDLPPAAQDYVTAFADPYFVAVAEWYDRLRIGAPGGELARLIAERLPHERFGIELNPGHLIHLDEWVSSPIYAGSTLPLRSGMAIQVDIIPSSPVYFSTRAEDGVVLADRALRQALAAQYPDLWARCQARRAFMADVLGIPLPDEVLPLSNAPGLVPPFFLAPNTVLTLEV